MENFEALNLTKPLLNAVADLGYERPTPIQSQAFSVILSGKDMVGVAQTGTGKTMAYLLPMLRELKFSNQVNPRILILVPTRELVVQVVEQVEAVTKYMSVRTLGVYGGVNISTQKDVVLQGCDVLVATPGRLYDLVLARAIQLKDVKRFVIDEVDIMLDLGFRFQITNLLELLPERRQNIMFSATMTDDVDELINDFFVTPERISIAVSGTRLENIAQIAYPVLNFYTKVNFLVDLLSDKETYKKVIIFASNKKMADKLFEEIEPFYSSEACIIHSNKSQNYRLRSMRQFEEGINRILIATDVMARGLDFANVTHVINLDTPAYPENYMHRIGRTGRAEEEGTAVLLFSEKEIEHKLAIEVLMNYEIPQEEFPEHIEISEQLAPWERKRKKELNTGSHINTEVGVGAAFHEKKAKNQKVNMGGSYKKKMAAKYGKKPKNRLVGKKKKR